MIDDVAKESSERMDKTIEALHRDLMTIRTGRASPSLVERVMVDAYGTQVPLQQLAGINAPEARLLVVQPYDRSTIGAIDKALRKADLGFNPSNDGTVLRIAVPALTEERRREMVKLVHRYGEDARVAVRNIRRDAIKDLVDLEHEKLISEDDLKRGQDRVQDITDRHIKQVDEIGKIKEQEVMSV
ncbi:MAG: ribosome recycling factor [Chloroflexi bacterium]|nr:ribosome recycling factor [Chloroflexota bacterium]